MFYSYYTRKRCKMSSIQFSIGMLERQNKELSFPSVPIGNPQPAPGTGLLTGLWTPACAGVTGWEGRTRGSTLVANPQSAQMYQLTDYLQQSTLVRVAPIDPANIHN